MTTINSAKWCSFLIVLLAFCAPVTAQQQAQTIISLTFEEALKLSENRPAVEAAKSAVQSSSLSEVLARRQINLPVAQVQGAYNHRNKVLSIETPVGAFDLGEKDGYTIDAVLVQPIYKPGTRSHMIPALRTETKAQGFQRDQIEREMKREAAFAFFDLLAVESRMTASHSYVKSLEERLNDATARVKVGRLLETEKMKVELGLLQARQELFALQRMRRVSEHQLGRAIGFPGMIHPDWDLNRALPAIPPMSSFQKSMIENRPELKSLNATQEALDLREKAISREKLPELDAILRYSHSEGESFSFDSMLEAKLQLKWKPFEAGTRKTRQAKLRAEHGKLKHQEEELRTGIALMIEAVYADLRIAKGAVEVAVLSVKLARETLRVENERFKNNRATANDLLVAEAALHNQETAEQVEKLNYLKTYFDLFYTTGTIWEGKM